MHPITSTQKITLKSCFKERGSCYREPLPVIIVKFACHFTQFFEKLMTSFYIKGGNHLVVSVNKNNALSTFKETANINVVNGLFVRM